MKRTGVFIVTGFVMLMFNIAADASDFLSLVSSGNIRCTASGNENSVHYAKPLKIRLFNNTKTNLAIEIPAGFIFRAEDSTYQDIVTTQTLLAVLNPGANHNFDVRGMCVKSGNAAPVVDAAYLPKGMAEPGLVKLAEFIEKHTYFSPAGQNAVWAYLDDKPLYTVASVDDAQARHLQEFLSELTGKQIIPIPHDEQYLYNYSQRPKNVVVDGEVNINVSYQIDVHWCLFDENGILLRELYNGSIGPGKVTLAFQYDATVYSEPVYYLKLVADGNLIYNSKMSTEGID
jgi:hypothetical protein